jgi:hypothetical protein
MQQTIFANNSFTTEEEKTKAIILVNKDYEVNLN